MLPVEIVAFLPCDCCAVTEALVWDGELLRFLAVRGAPQSGWSCDCTPGHMPMASCPHARAVVAELLARLYLARK